MSPIAHIKFITRIHFNGIPKIFLVDEFLLCNCSCGESGDGKSYKFVTRMHFNGFPFFYEFLLFHCNFGESPECVNHRGPWPTYQCHVLGSQTFAVETKILPFLSLSS
jgi:hypothetical protein